VSGLHLVSLLMQSNRLSLFQVRKKPATRMDCGIVEAPGMCDLELNAQSRQA